MAEPGSGSYGGMSEAQRNAIVEALLAQVNQQQNAPAAFMGEAVAGNPNVWPTDPSDPDAPGSPAAAMAAAHAVNAANNPDANTSSIGLNTAGLSTNTGNLSAQTGIIGEEAAEAGPVAQGQPAGLPAGFFGPGFNNPGETISGPPAQTANTLGDQLGLNDITGPVAQGLTLGGHNITGYNVAPAFNAFEGAPQASPAQQAAAPTGTPTGTPAAIADPAGYLAGLITEGDVSSAAPASTGNIATDVGVGIGLGISGGFGGATGDGTSGGFGADVGGPGIGGASTGISGGPGGTGEGGANTGEGGTSSGTSGSSGGGGDGGK